jgi:catechol-2,3-dioxygenase
MAEVAAPVSLNLLVLKTRQVEHVRAFYECLGVAFSEERHGGGPAHYAGQAGATVLEVYPLPDDGTAADRTTRLGFAVADLEKVLESLRASGTPVASPPRVNRVVVRDPDGRAVELLDMRRDA